METSLTKQEQTPKKASYKRSEILPSCWNEDTKLFAGHVVIGHEHHWTGWFSSKEEAQLELRCLEKRLSFEVIDTVEGEGYYPERQDTLEKLYQESGRTNGLYTGLITEQLQLKPC